MFHFILPKFNLNIEKWKWNSEYRVYVSNTGHFKNEFKKEIPVKVHKKGYIAIQTYLGLKAAHRLVLLTWRPIPNAEELTIDHLDHNKRNNSLVNLEWVTKEENSRRANRDFINKNEYSDRKILCKKDGIIFDTPEQAVEWAIKQPTFVNNPTFVPDNLTRERMKKKILLAAERKRHYAASVWAFV